MVMRMWYSTIFFALTSVVCPSIAITLSNGFTFDETKLMQIQTKAANILNGNCYYRYSDCADDCTTASYCEDYAFVQSYQCSSNSPYCVRDGDYNYKCSGNFPMDNPTCFAKAMDLFMCTGDGNFADPTDATKYHVCNGTNHSIVECPANHQYWFDPSIVNPSTDSRNGDYACRFRTQYFMCHTDRFSWKSNSYVFRNNDWVHYVYCLEIGSVKKMMMFKCPPGTSHGRTVWQNTVVCA